MMGDGVDPAKSEDRVAQSLTHVSVTCLVEQDLTRIVRRRLQLRDLSPFVL